MFWKNFVELCNSKNVMPTNAVKEIGIAAGSITKWKEGRIPRDSTLIKIAEYFGVSVEYLLGKEKENTPSNDERGAEFDALYALLSDEDKAVIKAQMEFMLARKGKP